MPIIDFNHGNMNVKFPKSPTRDARPAKETDSHGTLTRGVVYASESARRALSDEATLAALPAGSVIVREKYVGADEAAPQLLAVMFKRERGFNPKGGDWEFLVVDPALTKVRERQKQGTCLECHQSQSKRDFLFPLPPPPR